MSSDEIEIIISSDEEIQPDFKRTPSVTARDIASSSQEYKPLITTRSRVPLTSRTNKQQQSPKPDEWACSACTYLNQGGARCAICEGGRKREHPKRKTWLTEDREKPQWEEPNREEESLSLKSKKEGEDRKVKERKEKETLSCPRCTLENSVSSVYCDACGSSLLSKGQAGRKRKLEQTNGKSKERLPSPLPSSLSLSRSSSELWIHRWAPKTVKDLAIQSKKVQEVESWLTRSLESLRRGDAHGPKLLILCGRPGIGKSTMARLLAKERELEVLEWEDMIHVGSSAYGHRQMVQAFGFEGDWRGGDEKRETYTSSLSDFSTFLQRSSKYSSLRLTEGPSSSPMTGEGDREKREQLVLIDDLPLLSSSMSKKEFFSLLRSLLDFSLFPVVLIYSNVTENKVNPSQLASAFSSNIINDYRVSMIQLNPTPPGMMAKQLGRISRLAGHSLTETELQSLASTSEGDLRHAINSLQLYTATGGKKRGHKESKPKRKSRIVDDDQEREGERREAEKTKKRSAASAQCYKDPLLSSFHALGRLLHGKNTASPESVLESIDFDASTLSTFVQYNCPSFFSDIDHLADCLEDFSAGDWMSKLANYSSAKDLHGAEHTWHEIGSIACRTVGTRNEAPAPSSFRPLAKPQIFASQSLLAANMTALREVLPQRDCRLVLSLGAAILDTVPLELQIRHRTGFYSPYSQMDVQILDHISSFRGSAVLGGEDPFLSLRQREEREEREETLPPSAIIAEDEIQDFDETMGDAEEL